MAATTISKNRILSIDIIRALTMFFMIFVNDLWSITHVPKWLLHTKTNEDGMGFSDVIFPLFLFIVGLSIPLAINIRKKKNDNTFQIFKHILERTIALLVMGFFMVNYEYINNDALPFSKYIWQLLMATAILLIWLHYKPIKKIKKHHTIALKSLGALILIYLAFIYKGGTLEELTWMKPHWWGILGLIGWAYFLNVIVYLALGRNLTVLGSIFLLFNFLNVQEFGFFESLPAFKIVISASNYALVMAGVFCTSLFLKFKEKGKIDQFLVIISILGLLLISYGFLIRPSFIISKNLATPSWTSICIGIGYLTYVVLFIIIDKLGYYKWAKLIKPAGTSTLTCYLMPYFIYPLIALTAFKLPEFFTAGSIGIVKSLLFSLLIILFVGWLEKYKVRLKI
ncbi:DUF5009 domain-containing protein [Aureibaculum conchae]|uniref:DUF5009 domain-containing protein n=1 Tax=Aureibaculum sp. 2308TA14-22 TaxID=3108392 RepID=UPI0033981135